MNEEEKNENSTKMVNDEKMGVSPDYSQGRAIKLTDFVDLVIHPDKFFKSGIQLGKRKYLAILMAFIGIAVAIYQVDLLYLGYFKTYKVPISDHGLYFESWLSFFSLVLAFGVAAGGFVWLISGWWYNQRLSFCVEGTFDKHTGRVIKFYNMILITIPVYCVLLGYVMFYDSYVEGILSNHVFFNGIRWMILPLGVYGIMNSYRTVESLFKTNKASALQWFLVLPAVQLLVLYFMI